eukprot:11193771-Lingulodinium_polyedra.AAC.1
MGSARPFLQILRTRRVRSQRPKRRGTIAIADAAERSPNLRPKAKQPGAIFLVQLIRGCASRVCFDTRLGLIGRWLP